MVEPADRAAEAGTSGRLRGGTIGADFVFVIDGSSSMSGKINRVIEGLNAFVTHLHSVGVDARFAVVVYGGEPELVLDFTTSIDATKAALEKVTIGAVPGFQNNHDLNPEAGLEAIRAVLGAAARPLAIDHVGGSTRLRFRETARKNLILVTDEDSDIPCHGENRLPGQTSLDPPNEIADTSWQREVDLTAQAVIENQAFVNLLINPEEQPSRFQYGDPDSSVADAKLLNFDAQATLSRLKENGYGKCLEAQVLKAGLIGRAFNVIRVGDENFVKNFFAAKVEEVAKRANVARLTVVHQGGALPPALMPAVELILDSSGSMKEEVEGTPKNRIARRMMDQVLGDLPNQLKVGMRLFGHWGRFVRRMLEKDGTAGPVSWEDPIPVELTAGQQAEMTLDDDGNLQNPGNFAP